MAKRIYANVKPEILRWARVSAGFNLPEAAEALRLEDEVLISWEDATASPSVAQLRNLAQLYKRPLAVFYLQDVPKSFQVISDFRRPSEHAQRFSPALTHEVRMANQRRELARELFNDLGEPVRRFTLAFQTGPLAHAEAMGASVREFLDITDDTRNAFASEATGRKAFNTWRQAVEDVGVLVFQSTRVPADEASGFALAYPQLPVIVVNRKDPPVRRLFSLVHELAHIALQKSGVSDLRIENIFDPVDADIETFCNRVAAAALMPKDMVLGEAAVQLHGKLAAWSDTELLKLSRRYGVSRESMLIRLLSFDRTTKAFYLEKRAQYEAERAKERQKQLAEPSESIPRDMPQETISNFGRSFINLVLGNYYQDKLTLSEVSGYLGLRTRHVPKLEEKLRKAA